MNPFEKRLDLLRTVLVKYSIDAYLIPSADPHLSEYIPDHWLIIPWLTGFTGSSGTVVVTDSFAGLWTDSRYYIQAEKQLNGSGYQLVKPKALQTADCIDWLKENLNTRASLAFDGRLFSVSYLRKIEKILRGKNVTVNTNCDLISELWTDRPLLPDSLALNYPVEYCGKERSRKIAEVRDSMKRLDVSYHLITSPDDIMWLLNIRGNDIKYSPLMLSFAIVGEEQILLFTDKKKIPPELKAEFTDIDVNIYPYEAITEKLAVLTANKSILIDPATTSVTLYKSVPETLRIVEDISIPSRIKSIKNKTEIKNIGKVTVRDGVALSKFFYWFEQNIDKFEITELTISEKLLRLRSQEENFQGPSFETIAAFNEHGALPHYKVTKESDAQIGREGILLIDSGGHYLEGTTDITRTIVIGTPSEQHKTDFTLVLKGMINLALAKFPLGTRGYQLDILARKALWENGLNYGHGTGHGVGFYLNVHEGPHNISPSTSADNNTIIEPGMIFSNEPAIYREGEYGIRTENLMICYEDEETEFGQFLKFDTVTLCYIDKALIDKSLLDSKEFDWLNTYHAEVYEKLGLYLTAEEREWLKDKTSQLVP
jgi:Xaa-Pro aminopeptidase